MPTGTVPWRAAEARATAIRLSQVALVAPVGALLRDCIGN